MTFLCRMHTINFRHRHRIRPSNAFRRSLLTFGTGSFFFSTPHVSSYYHHVHHSYNPDASLIHFLFLHDVKVTVSTLTLITPHNNSHTTLKLTVQGRVEAVLAEHNCSRNHCLISWNQFLHYTNYWSTLAYIMMRAPEFVLDVNVLDDLPGGSRRLHLSQGEALLQIPVRSRIFFLVCVSIFNET